MSIIQNTNTICIKPYELWIVRWVVRIVSTVRQTVYKRTDVRQLCTLSVARFPRPPVTANTNSTPKADTLNYMQSVRARKWRPSLLAYRVPTIHSKLHSLRNKQVVVGPYTVRFMQKMSKIKSEHKISGGGHGGSKPTEVSTKAGR
jgi:hypothetical protein